MCQSSSVKPDNEAINGRFARIDRSDPLQPVARFRRPIHEGCIFGFRHDRDRRSERAKSPGRTAPVFRFPAARYLADERSSQIAQTAQSGKT